MTVRASSPQRRVHQSGYALMLVLGSLALITFVAAHFASRVDALRRQVQSLQDYAHARLKASNALEVALFHVTTRPGGRQGFGLGPELVVADGRPYTMPDGAAVAVTDERGLLSLHVADLRVLQRLVQGLGASASDADALVDVLLDYTDSDNLKRLNGAEAPAYSLLGLPRPRNEWLVSTRELGRMPLWRDQPGRIARMGQLTSTRVSGFLNPNLAPLPVLRSLMPEASPDQLDLFDKLRQARGGFDNGHQAREATGLPLTGEDYLFHTSYEQAYTAWAPGMPTSVYLQVKMTPESPIAPWQVIAVHAAPPLGVQAPARAWPRPPSAPADARP